MNPDRERLARLLGGAERAALRASLRRRFEQGLRSTTITLTGLATAEREALEGLLGRPPRSADSMRVELAELDRVLARAGLAPSLREALEALDGPIRDLAAERTEHAARWASVLAQIREPRLAALAAASAGRGLLKRLAANEPGTGAMLLASAAEVLARLPAPGAPRSRLAAEVLHDAHALDDGRAVATLVLAVLRSEDDERAREVWARAGVLVNELAAPALALNLPVEEATPAGMLAATAARRGEPFHLSLRALLRTPPRWQVAGRSVFVCENANVVAIAADRLGAACAPLACTDGAPAAAQRALLAQLAAAGAVLRYHGDFDWPGIHIGNYVMRNFGALPWRFGAGDYAPGRGRKLEGKAVPAAWDTALAPKMAEHGWALDEESVVEGLLGDLAQ